MAKINEETLNNWRMPPSNCEEEKLLQVEKMIKDAIAGDVYLQKMPIKVFGQGSYSNDTNVRLNSDVDINVMYTGAYYYDLPQGYDKEYFELTNPSKYVYKDFKKQVEDCLVNKFGRTDVRRGNISLHIAANTNRIEADVVPTFEYRYFFEDKRSVQGTRLFSDKNETITNYPEQHLINARDKNRSTQKRYKRLTRILKRVKYKMIADKINVSDSITSFLIESLLWNVDNYCYNDYFTWTDRLEAALSNIYENTKDEKTCKEWGEVSELLYLFRPYRKWTVADVNHFVVQTYQYLEF